MSVLTLLRDVMSRELETVSARATIKEAATRMRAFNIGMLLVRDGNELVGVITDRDITIRAVTAKDVFLDEVTVGQYMSPGVLCLWETQSVEEAARLMEINHVHRLVVIDKEHYPVGVFTVGDLARNQPALAVRVIHTISQSVPSISGSPWLR